MTGLRGCVGPLSRLLACLIPVAGAFAIDNARQGLLCLGAELLVLGWLARDVRSSAGRLVLGLVAATSILISTWLYGGHDADEALGAGLRILFIVLPAALLTPSIQPSQLGDHLAQRLRLPARTVVASVAALQRLDSTLDQWQTIQRSRRARGLGLDGGLRRRARGSAASAFALLVVSLRQTADTAMAMDARGFAGATRRTWAEPAPWTWGDSVILTTALGLAVLPWLLR